METGDLKSINKNELYEYILILQEIGQITAIKIIFLEVVDLHRW
jgi:hypothetical protein